MSKHIAILGSTGSIGTQTLEVVEANPDDFIVDVLTANNNIELLIQQAKKFHPDVVVIACEEKYTELSEALKNEPIKVYAGIDAIAQVVQMSAIDVVVTAMVGYSGLLPTIKAIEAKKNIALANKETLVVAGEIIQRLALENGVNIYPVDSEHSAIFQCLSGEFDNSIEKIYLTASGGPFRGKDKKFLENVSSKQALQHPNWDMGAKITIDSASMMNKGFEAIEAKWLFDLKASQIDVIVHPQSIVHSIVQFEDGSMKAQMGLPDMKLPIQFALTYPKRLKTDFPRFNFLDYPNLSFEAADSKNFKNLNLAFQAMEKGGNLPCIVNAANEMVVDAFLRDEVGFLRMSDIIEDCMHKTGFIKNPTYEDYVLTDKEARKLALSML
ncbi:1-deoxy-D-xylulose-5-phosphate reductoisomerase [Labilibaculum sp. A4]|uniref:1-deoxy-D-xylulose-5-phosphate reductoisomerase n=1 Tax=Labilibaculum euxinus TaxID=2686357 RepID=UPI000F627DD7|nr:1-deoxy-D-xylulose-5-phosphate reductoisomerase [Labilibaculum euxinus]MDQ1772594.1 1-deoxy-D-xylulose-5-phosphate reductoisomerase [Labilibaculum euxinus]MWN78365.1 1-deoxy-D-xylulose-5-phosphate reductoisomerase [Labilibaculum euxinus]